jgi:hypothetical protein
MAKRNRTNTDLQHTMQTTKYRIARTPLNTGGELKYSGTVSSSCSISPHLDMSLHEDMSLNSDT